MKESYNRGFERIAEGLDREELDYFFNSEVNFDSDKTTLIETDGTQAFIAHNYVYKDGTIHYTNSVLGAEEDLGRYIEEYVLGNNMYIFHVN